MRRLLLFRAFLYSIVSAIIDLYNFFFENVTEQSARDCGLGTWEKSVKRRTAIDYCLVTNLIGIEHFGWKLLVLTHS